MGQKLPTAMSFWKYLIWQNVRTWIQVTDADPAKAVRIWGRPVPEVDQKLPWWPHTPQGEQVQKFPVLESTHRVLIVYYLFVILLLQAAISCALDTLLSLQFCHELGTSLD